MRSSIRGLLFAFCATASVGVWAQSEFDDPLSDVAGIKAPLKRPVGEPAADEEAKWSTTFAANYGQSPSSSAFGGQLVFVSPQQRWRIATGASQRNPEASTDNFQAYVVGADYTFDAIGRLSYSAGVEAGRVTDIENFIEGGFGFEYALSDATALSLNLGYGHSDPETGSSESDLTSTVGIGHTFTNKLKVGLSFEPENDLNGRDTWRLSVSAGALRFSADDHDSVGVKWIVAL